MKEPDAYEAAYQLAAKVAGIKEVCLKCGRVWASWLEGKSCPECLKLRERSRK